MTGLRLVANNESTISLAWDAGQDNVAVKSYVVKGDGFATFQTTETRATLSWPHRTASVSVLVSAVDTAGNQGEWRSLTVTPPVTATTATTTPTAAPTTTDPAVRTDPPSDPASSDSATTTAPSTEASTLQSTAVQDPGTSGALADPASSQPS